ncbi:MAG: NTP transferase domain-containing protein, partial [Pyrinomonadaceae bacterium]|nr:NTP transferase domain-containing protein [Pyrinomonadaceae bacterium]
MNTAIIVAAGSGKRFGSDTPKQFHPILGKPVVIHTLQRFEDCDLVKRIILVLDKNETDSFSKTTKQFGIRKIDSIVSGGESRAESVRKGFEAIKEDFRGVVAVHDGARPLVSTQEISETIQTAQESGAACLVANVTDTIKEVSGGVITKTVDRTNLRRALTPQCFRYEL